MVEIIDDGSDVFEPPK